MFELLWCIGVCLLKCDRCSGSGEIDETFKIGEDIYGDGLQTCPKCDGAGVND